MFFLLFFSQFSLFHNLPPVTRIFVYLTYVEKTLVINVICIFNCIHFCSELSVSSTDSSQRSKVTSFGITFLFMHRSPAACSDSAECWWWICCVPYHPWHCLTHRPQSPLTPHLAFKGTSTEWWWLWTLQLLTPVVTQWFYPTVSLTLLL